MSSNTKQKSHLTQNQSHLRRKEFHLTPTEDKILKWVSTEEAIETLCISRSTLFRRIRQNEIQTKKIDNARLVGILTDEEVSNDTTQASNDTNQVPHDTLKVSDDTKEVNSLKEQITYLKEQVEDQRNQLRAKDQQIEKLQQALDQAQQLHAVSQKSIESQRLKLEEYQRPKPLIARLKAVFVTE